MRDTLRFVVPAFLTPRECARWIADTEALGYEEAPITMPWGFVHDPTQRDNTRVMRDDPEAAAALWEMLRPYVSAADIDGVRWRPVGLNERLRFYRYTHGQRFRWHRDGCFRRGPGEESLLTFLVYLDDDFEGGATEFSDRAVVPRAGDALLFSHRMLHQGAAVTRGVKHVLRSDVMFRRERA